MKELLVLRAKTYSQIKCDESTDKKAKDTTKFVTKRKLSLKIKSKLSRTV